jgi:hypothetical protein
MKELAPEITAELLHRYGIHAPVTDARYLSHAQVDRGYRLSIELSREDVPHIVVRHGVTEVLSLLPLAEFAANGLISALCAPGIPTLSPRAHAMLAHLLVQSSKLFVAENLSFIALDPVYLRDNDYRVINVRGRAKKRLRVKKRLTPAAHDASGVFAYRPTARLR